MPAGQPTKYDASYHDKNAYKLALLGLTDKEMASFFEVTEQTINNWKNAHPQFFESLKKGKEIADAKVSMSLLKRATGYKAKATKFFYDKDAGIVSQDYVEHYPPDPTSMIFWLKNRQPGKWRDKQEISHSLTEPQSFNIGGQELKF